MKTVQSLALAAGLASVASAHMEMLFPAPFKSKANPHAGQDIDYSMLDPIKGSNFPCKGYHSLFGTPAGASTADFTAGQAYEMTIAGGANHEGGSCQASLSFDKGATWKVIHSYIGDCPVSGESKLPFTVPADTPAGEAIFAWTWFNKVGNREMYMNCAAVNIVGGGASKRQASTPFSSRPDMFVANVDNGCSVAPGIDVEFPNPGPDVTTSSNAKKGAPDGNCGSAAPPSPGGDQNPVQSQAPVQSQPPVVPTQAPVQSSQVAPDPGMPTASDSGDVFITVPGGVASSQAPVAPPAASSQAPVVPPPAASSQAPVVPPVVTSEAPAVPTQSVAPSSPAPAASKTDECNISSVTRPGTPSTMVTVPAPPKPTGPSTPVAPVPTPGNPTGGAGGFAAGTACTTEGQWNCVSGSQFQRCAAGQWSILQPMASGVTCVPGQSDNLSYAKRAPRALWWV